MTDTQAGRPLVKTRAGTLRGIIRDGCHAFLGVRYGADTSARRFRRALPEPAWDGVRDADAYGPRSPQNDIPVASIYSSWVDNQPMSEDCLNLNVWTPALDDAKRPVMVWLHGGGFMAGSGNIDCYQAKRLAAQHDTVQVAVTHRLNAFGFLYLADHLGPDYAESGNVGLLDIVLALEWVRDNIAAFGGDPDNVMIYGESGGGGKVSSLMALPEAKGLFHRAYVQSGSMLSAMTPDASKAEGQKLFDALALQDGDAAALVDMPLDRLASGLATAFPAMGGFGPVIDGKVLHKAPFLPDAPAESADVPVMVGTTQTEMTGLLGGMDPTLFSLSWEELPQRLAFAFGFFGRIADYAPVDAQELVDKARALRPGIDAGRMFFELTTEAIFHHNALRQADRKVEQGAAPAYVYVLDYQTPVDGGKWGSPHAIDIPLTMLTQPEAKSILGPDLQASRSVADAMSRAWVAFARTGNPGTSELPWPAYDTVDRPTMVFDLESRVVNDPHGAMRRLIDDTKA